MVYRSAPVSIQLKPSAAKSWVFSCGLQELCPRLGSCRSPQPWEIHQELGGTEHRGLLQKSQRRKSRGIGAQPPPETTFLAEGMVLNPAHPPQVLCPAGNETFLEYPTFSSRCCLHSSTNTALRMWFNTGMGQWWPCPLACLALPQAAAELLVKTTILQRSWLIQITASDN